MGSAGTDQNFASVNEHARLVRSRYLRVLWGEKIGYEDGLRRAGCHGKRVASRYFSFASSHDTQRASIHPRIQSSHPAKHVNSDWVRVCEHATFDGVVYFFLFECTKLLTLFKEHY